MSKADEQTAPTEAEVKASNEAEQAKWEGDFKEEDLVVPYKREAEEPQKDDESKTEEVEAEPIEEAETFEPEPVVTLQDPGEYKAADYSFKVVNKDGKSVTIKTPEEADAFAEDDDNFKTAKDLKEFLRSSQKMENNLERDHAEWEAASKTFTDQTEEEQGRVDNVNNIANEIEYLVSKNKLPKVDPQYLTVSWNDPEVAKQPGVKEQVALINYMAKENRIRAKAGIKPFGPIDAFTTMQSDESEKARIEADKQAGENRKAAGARVAGVSASQTGTFVPKGIAVGRVIPRHSAAVWDN